MKVGKYVVLIQIILLIINILLFDNFSYFYIIISQIILMVISITNFKKIQSIFSPLNIFIIACEISFTIKGLNILGIEKFTQSNFNKAFILYIIFIIGVLIGLRVYIFDKIISIYNNLTKRQINKKSFFIYTIIAIPLCIIIYLKMLGTSNLSIIFSNLLNNRMLFQNSGGLYVQTLILTLLKISVYVLFIFILEKEKFSCKKILFIISFLVLLIITLSLGGRGEIIFPIIALLFIYERVRHKVSLKKMLVLGILIVVFSGWYGMLRDGENLEKTNISDNINNVLNRYVQLDNLIRLASNPIDYKFGQSFVDFVLSPIPRSILPNKSYPFNSQMTQIYLPEQAERKIVSDFTAVGELYLNFGYIGILIGGILFGAVLNYVIYIYMNDKSRFFLILYPFLMLKPMSILYGGMINSNANMMLILEFCLISFLWIIVTNRSEEKNEN